MKYFLLGFIKTYQMIPGPWHNCCRHTPTCSNYGIEAIIKYYSSFDKSNKKYYDGCIEKRRTYVQE